MTAPAMKPRLTSFAPQFLVDDLERSIGYVGDLLRALVTFAAPPLTTYAASGRAQSGAAAALGVVDRRA